MNKMILVYILVIFFCSHHIINFGGAIVINAVIYAYDSNNEYFTSLVNDFNEYSKTNSLNITINLNAITALEGDSNDFSSFIGAHFAKKLKKYDIFFNSARVSSIYASHYEDLKKYLSIDYSKQFHPEIYKACVNEERLIGLPVTVDITGLYSNKVLLNKYEKRVPKTWEELKETAKYILEEEKKVNNTNLIPYNGIFCDGEDGTSSLYEFIYSFRDSIGSPFPDLKSKNAKNALKMIKQIKEELNLEDILKLDKNLVFTKFDGSAIFLKFWYYDNVSPYYITSPLPGQTEGVSSGIIGGSNIGINKYSDEENKIAAAKAIEYMTSEYFHKKYLVMNSLYSPRVSLYEDEEVCTHIDCSLMKSFQPIPRPYNRIKDYEDYSSKFRQYAYEYIYGNKTVEDALMNMYNIDHIYYLSLSTEDTSIGLIISIIYSFSSIFILTSLALLYIKKYKSYFKFFTKDLWCMVIIGIILQLFSRMLEIGSLNSFKCHLEIFFYSFGYIFILIPTLYKLICNFPEENNFSNWIKIHKYPFIILFLIFDALLCLLYMMFPYELTTIIGSDRKNFQVCNMKDSIGQSIMIMIIGFKGIIIIGIGYLLFVEWNIKETALDIQYITSAVYVNCIGIIAINILNYLKFNNYITYYLVHQIVFFIFTIVNYIFYYAFRIFIPLFNKNKNIFDFSGQLNIYHNSNTNNELKMSVNSNQGNKSHISSNGKFSKVLDYHFRTSIEKKSIDDNSSCNSEKNSHNQNKSMINSSN
ncbi:periplasmic binding protein-like II [Piromyces finnis]|uniref:Periplasmic binding protein-like II n=1 Tax=Piromyces finnis TaxID=1754191 RepID=A0A1Y1V4G2_9FUNG|nr:periplasmic binding protein-like II [Piromyces finnis]|eukprot:ORX45738.1 periplasmic binding protein-like II [Piromyces finnis]